MAEKKTNKPAANQLRTRQPQPREPIVVLVGEHGVGKSTFGSQAPAPVFIATEDGTSNMGGIELVEVDGMLDGDPCVRTWPVFLDCLQAVLTAEHSYKTLVIDTMNGAASLLAHYVCQAKYGGRWAAVKGGGEAFMSYGQGWKTCAEEIKQALRLLERINAERGMLVILTTHVGLHNLKNPRLGDYQRIEGDIEKPIWSVISNWADLVILADYEITVIEKERKAYSTNVRILRCGGSVAEDTKCRAGFEIPNTMPFSFDGFYSALKDTTNTTLADVMALWPKLDADRQKAALAWLGVSSEAKFATLPIDRLRILYNSMVEAVGDVPGDDPKTDKE